MKTTSTQGAPAPAAEEDVRLDAYDQCADMLRPHVQPECLHDDTQRLGAIWTKCNQCERSWADDDPKNPIAQQVAPAQSDNEEELLCNLAQFINAAEQDWKIAGHWSAWDQSVVEGFNAYRARRKAELVAQQVAPAPAQPNWVSVTERLPAPDGKHGYSQPVIVNVVCENGARFRSEDRYDTLSKTWEKHHGFGYVVRDWQPWPPAPVEGAPAPAQPEVASPVALPVAQGAGTGDSPRAPGGVG